ncbi:MAG: dihydroxyacetone kinase subunit DhaL [Nocardioidaceae bacterium]
MADEEISVAALTAWLRDFATVIHDNVSYLTELDSAIGDADHGANMDRGTQAVVAAVEGSDFETADALFKKVGMTLVSTVGGASGPLYGTFFLRFGAALQGEPAVTADSLGEAFAAGVQGVVSRGKAEPGDKTMVDAWNPALAAYRDALAAGKDLRAALTAGAEAAATGRDATTPMVARKGRASYLGDRSADHQDPGATSTALLWQSAASTLAS